jgi:hypothetical protein
MPATRKEPRAAVRGSDIGALSGHQRDGWGLVPAGDHSHSRVSTELELYVEYPIWSGVKQAGSTRKDFGFDFGCPRCSSAMGADGV